MKKILLALLAVLFVASAAMAVNVPTSDTYGTIILTSADPVLTFNNGDQDYVQNSSVLLRSEYVRNFLFDMGNASVDPLNSNTGKLSVMGAVRTDYPTSTSVKHTVSVFGPGKLGLAGVGAWGGLTTIAYDHGKDYNNGYVQLLSDYGLPTINSVTLNVPSDDLKSRSVLDLNGYTQSIRDMINSYDITGFPQVRNAARHGTVDLEGDRAGKIKDWSAALGGKWDADRVSFDATASLIYPLSQYDWSDKDNWMQGKEGHLLLQSSYAPMESNDLGFITGYGQVQLTNTLTTNAPTVYGITVVPMGRGARAIYKDAETMTLASADANYYAATASAPVDRAGSLGLVGFFLGDGTGMGNRVTLKIAPNHAIGPGTPLYTRIRYLASDATTSSKVDLQKMIVTPYKSADTLIIDTDGNYAYYGDFEFPPAGTYVDGALPTPTPPYTWAANFVKTGYGTQTVTQNALKSGAVFKADEKWTTPGGPSEYVFQRAMAVGEQGIGRSSDPYAYQDGELKFLMLKDQSFEGLSNKFDRPFFLPGSGWFGFDVEEGKARTANLGMLMDSSSATVDTNDWPTSAAGLWTANYSDLVPLYNNNVHVYKDATLAGAIFGMISADANNQFKEARGNPKGTAPITPNTLALLDPEYELVKGEEDSANKYLAFKEIAYNADYINAKKADPAAGNLWVDGTVRLSEWSWSALGTILSQSTGTIYMDSPSTQGYTYTNPTYTFLRVERGSTLNVKFLDQYHRAVLWLGTNKSAHSGTGEVWDNRFFRLGEDFQSTINRIAVTRGATLTVDRMVTVDEVKAGKSMTIDSSVAFYGETPADEPPTYRVNIGDGKASTLSVTDRNEFFFTDPVQRENMTDGTVELEFHGSCRKGDTFVILRGQNASDGEFRFRYEKTEFRLYSLPEELNRNLYAEALVDRLAPEVIGVGQPGVFSYSLSQINNNKIALGVIVSPDNAIAYSYEGDPLPAGVEFGGTVNGVAPAKGSTVPAGTFRITKELLTGFTGYVSAENLYGWGAEKQFSITTSTPVPPVTPTDAGMATVSGDISAGFKTGDAVSVTYVFDPKYDVTTAKAVTLPSGWTMVTDAATNSVTVSGTMPASDVSFYFTAVETATGTLYKSGPITIKNSDTPTPPKPGDGDGGGGCDAGFAGLALLLAAPLFLRKKD